MEVHTRVKTSEPLSDRKKRARRILAGLKKLYPDAGCALDYRSPFELLVATILSAQCTDKRVNVVAPELFKRCPTPRKLAAAKRETIEKLIQSTGFFRQKAKSLQGASRMIVDDFGGDVPDTMAELVTLPGVARKTANCVLGTAFGKNEGVVVDTHVGRLAERMGLTWTAKNSKDAVKIENDLIEIFPRKEWTFLSHALILHGRQICSARKPKCETCALAKNCPSAEMPQE